VEKLSRSVCSLSSDSRQLHIDARLALKAYLQERSILDCGIEKLRGLVANADLHCAPNDVIQAHGCHSLQALSDVGIPFCRAAVSNNSNDSIIIDIHMLQGTTM